MSRIQGAQKALEDRPNPFLFKLEKELLAEYEETLMHEELLWFQKSRSNWIQFGDKNTKFFQTFKIIRRRRNKIDALKMSDNSWCVDQSELQTMVLCHFQEVYSTEPCTDNITNLFLPSSFTFNVQQLDSFIQIPSEDEIYHALKTMSP
ncbi:hypothetical protein REPUB_Repub07fG0106000 [Reevesia pubescens]